MVGRGRAGGVDGAELTLTIEQPVFARERKVTLLVTRLAGGSGGDRSLCS